MSTPEIAIAESPNGGTIKRVEGLVKTLTKGSREKITGMDLRQAQISIEDGKDGTLILSRNVDSVAWRGFHRGSRTVTEVEYVDPKPLRDPNGVETYISHGVEIVRDTRKLAKDFPPEQQFSLKPLQRIYIKEGDKFVIREADNSAEESTNQEFSGLFEEKVSESDLQDLLGAFEKIDKKTSKLLVKRDTPEQKQDKEYTKEMSEKVLTLLDQTPHARIAKNAVEHARAQQEVAGKLKFKGMGQRCTYIMSDGSLATLRQDYDPSKIRIERRFGKDVNGLRHEYRIPELNVIEFLGTEFRNSTDLEQEGKDNLKHLVDRLIADRKFIGDISHEVKKLLAVAELKKTIKIDGNTITTEFMSPDGERIFISAKKEDDGTLSQIDLEKRLPPDPDRPRVMESVGYYIDPLSSMIVAKKRSHTIDISRGNFQQPGGIGFTADEKIALYEDPTKCADLQIRQEERKELLVSLAAPHGDQLNKS